MIATPERLRRRPALLGAGVVAVALIVAWVGTWAWARTVAQNVSVSWEPTCEGTSLVETPEGTAIRAVSDWACTIRLTVHNDSRQSVHVARIVAPLVGPATGGAARGRSTADARFANADGIDGAIDGFYEVDLDIPAHASQEVDLGLEWNPDGCVTAGTWWVSDWPTVAVGVWHRRVDVEADRSLVLAIPDAAPSEPDCAAE